MRKQLGMLDPITPTAGEEGAAENVAALEHAKSPTVSVVSKEQAMLLLRPGQHGRAAANRRRRSRSKAAAATTAGDAEGETGTEDSSLEGKFVDVVDLLLPVPSKGEFDVNKIKSSLYFFS